MQLVRLIFLLIMGISIIIKPTLILSNRFVRRRSDSPLIPLPADQSYDKSTMLLWRVFGIAITIFSIWFLLKNFNIL